ncbi:MAG TPA: M1 family metallopeptidase, partial [Bacteroidia bacterium]|nr:M1 family metallopeptidase [Bacteroidia bacterium]
MYKKIFLLILLLKSVFFSVTGTQVANCKSTKSGNLTSEANVLANNSRSDTVDILNYSINLSITNFTSKVISGFCTIKFISKINGLQYLDLDLLKLTVDSVKQHDTLLTSTYNDTLLRLFLTGSLALADTDSVSVYYHGVPQTDATGWGGFYFTPTYAYNLGVGFGADPHVYGRVWFPCFDNFIERSTYDFTITTASGKKAACNGVLTAHTINANLTENWTWKLDQTIPTYLACVAIAAYKTVHQNFTGINGNVPVELQGVALDTTGIKNSFVNLQAAFNTFEQRYGAYQWDKIGYSFVPFTGGAMEHATNITYPRSFATGSLSFESIMAHELSHHWWGDLITCRTQEDMWLNEGMASYSENLFTENVYGSDQYTRDVKSNLTEILHFTHHKEGGYQPISGIPHSLTYSDHVYLKGKAVAHCLRGYMGDTLFFAGLHYFLTAKKFSDVSSYDFRDALETSSGLNLHAF